MNERLRTLYKPRGRAGEFADASMATWQGCTHGCVYCFNHSRDKSKFRTAEEMAKACRPCGDVLRKLRQDIEDIKNGEGPWSEVEEGVPHILFQFTGDPYPPYEVDVNITRGALKLLRDAGLSWDILTKGGLRAFKDFDLYEGTKSRFAQTVVFREDALRQKHEPGASVIAERFHAFKAARIHRIPTWMSVEPVCDAAQALAVIRDFAGAVDFIKVGKINEHEMEGDVDWPKFGIDLAKTLEEVGIRYYIKDSTKPFMPSGFPMDTREGGE